MPPDPAPAKRALVVGRFQPPHLGHLHLLHEAARRAARTVVVIGSADKGHAPENPFTAGERIAMVAALADEADLHLEHVIPVDDLDRYPLWVAHVTAHVPPFDLVVTGSPLTAHLFASAGHTVHRVPLHDRARLNATNLRARLAAGDDVADAVPGAVYHILSEPWAKERLRALRA